MTKEQLAALGVTEEQITAVLKLNEDETAVKDAEITAAKADLTAAKEQLAQRDKDMETLQKSAKGQEEIQSQLAVLQEKYAADTEALKKQVAERDYEAAIRSTIADKKITFSSKSAEKAYLAEAKAKAFENKNGKLIGFDDFHTEYAKGDPGAFQVAPPAPGVAGKSGSAPPLSLGMAALHAREYSAKLAPAVPGNGSGDTYGQQATAVL